MERAKDVLGFEAKTHLKEGIRKTLNGISSTGTRRTGGGRSSMASSGRYVNPSLSELLDRLTVDQIKEILLPPEEESFGKEIERIEHDLDHILSSGAFRLTSRFLRLVIALAQMNLHIWKTKERMMSDPSRFDEHLKLSHQLNGLRNQLKNALLEETGVREGTLGEDERGHGPPPRLGIKCSGLSQWFQPPGGSPTSKNDTTSSC